MQESTLRRDMDRHHREVIGRIDRMEARTVKRFENIEARFDDHSHTGRYVKWGELVGVLLPLAVGFVGLVFLVAG